MQKNQLLELFMKRTYILPVTIIILIGCLFAGGSYVLQLDKLVTERLEGRRWEMPSCIFAQLLELLGLKSIQLG